MIEYISKNKAQKAVYYFKTSIFKIQLHIAVITSIKK